MADENLKARDLIQGRHIYEEIQSLPTSARRSPRIERMTLGILSVVEQGAKNFHKLNAWKDEETIIALGQAIDVVIERMAVTGRQQSRERHPSSLLSGEQLARSEEITTEAEDPKLIGLADLIDVTVGMAPGGHVTMEPTFMNTVVSERHSARRILLEGQLSEVLDSMDDNHPRRFYQHGEPTDQFAHSPWCTDRAPGHQAGFEDCPREPMSEHIVETLLPDAPDDVKEFAKRSRPTTHGAEVPREEEV